MIYIYKINYSHFLRDGWRGVLKWCKIRVLKITISVSTIDFQPTLTYESISADLHRQCLTSFCAVYGVLFDYKRESTVESSGVRDVMLMTYICYQCLYATLCNQTWYCGASPWAGMSWKKWDSLIKVKVTYIIKIWLFLLYLLLVLNQWVLCNQTQFDGR